MRKIYAKEEYIILYSDERKNYTVYNTKKEWHEGHTHMNGYKQAVYLIDCELKKKIPEKVNKYFLVSLTRITRDKKYKERVQRKIDNKESKLKFYNTPKGFHK